LILKFIPMAEFGTPGFNADAWINAKLASSERASVSREITELTSQFQVRHKTLSKTTNHHMQTLLDELPKAMATFSQIGSTVNDLSESLRLLTNSGYKFKSGNVPDKIKELTELRVRRDRLKDASERLQHGLEFESDVSELKHAVSDGSLQLICTKYKELATAAAALSSIPRFGAANSQLSSSRSIIENRLKQELRAAISGRKSDDLVKLVHFSQQISAESLPADAITSYYEHKIKDIVSTFTSGPLSITDWLKSCFDQTHDLTVELAQWALSFHPPFFHNRLRLEFLNSLSQILTPAIDGKTQILLGSCSFPAILRVRQTISDFVLSFPAEWRVPPDLLLSVCVETIQKWLPNGLQAHLDRSLRPVRPQVSAQKTGGALGPNEFAEWTKIALLGMEWIQILSPGSGKCAAIVQASVVKVVTETITQLNAWVAERMGQDGPGQLLESVLRYYVSQCAIEAQLGSFEQQVSVFGTKLQAVGKFNELKSVTERHIVELMSAASIAPLANVHGAPEWAMEGDADDLLPGQISESRYMKGISRCFLDSIQKVGCFTQLQNDLVRAWLAQTATNVTAAFVKEFLAIPKLSSHGQQQLKADLVHLQGWFSSLNLEIGRELSDIVALLSAEGADRESLMRAGAMSPNVVSWWKSALETGQPKD
jgi:hypothetical protein